MQHARIEGLSTASTTFLSGERGEKWSERSAHQIETDGCCFSPLGLICREAPGVPRLALARFPEGQGRGRSYFTSDEGIFYLPTKQHTNQTDEYE